jgi:hypothetical protein
VVVHGGTAICVGVAEMGVWMCRICPRPTGWDIHGVALVSQYMLMMSEMNTRGCGFAQRVVSELDLRYEDA